MFLKILDTLPGSGKTEYFVKKVFGTGTETLVYAAPSLELLCEVAERVKFADRDVYLLAHKAVPVPSQVTRVEGKVAALLAQLLGINYTQPAKQGSVILTTHEALFGLPAGDLAHRAVLFFDEARKCLTHETSVSLDKEVVRTFAQCFGVRKERKIKGSNYLLCTITALPTQNQLDSAFAELHSKAMVLSQLRDSLYKYIGSAKKGRFDAKLLMETGANKAVRIFVFLRPDSVFEGFRSVVFLGAQFRESQMFHLLAQAGHKFEDVKDEDSREVRRRDKALRERLKTRLVAIPLCESGSRDMLTKNALSRDLLVPKNFNTALSPAEFLKVKSPEQLERFKAPMLFVLIREALSRMAPHNCRPLLVKNRTGTVWNGKFDPNRSIDLLRGGAVDSSVTGLADVEVGSYWKAFITQYLGNNRKVTTLSQVVLHGLNKYKDHNAIIHLAALNPSPSTIYFYKSYIPEYDYDADHTVENLVQALYRTSLRDPSSDEKVYLAVAYDSVVKQLEEKLGQRITRLSAPRLKVLGGQERKKAKPKVDKGVRRALGAEINRLKASVRYWKAKQEDAPENLTKQLAERIEERKKLVGK